MRICRFLLLYALAFGLFGLAPLKADLVAPCVITPNGNSAVSLNDFNTEFNIYGPTSVTITCDTPGAVIHYLLNSNSTSYPDETSPTIPSGGTVTVYGDVLLQARAFADGMTTSFSETLFHLKIKPLVFNPPPGTYPYGTPITFSSETTNVLFGYSIDYPTGSLVHTQYDGSIILTNPMVLTATAALIGYDYISTQAVYHIVRYETGAVTTFAGTNQPGNSNGDRLSARFNGPRGLCMDAGGTMYVADSGNGCVRKITPDGQVSTLPGTFSSPYGLCLDSQTNLYVSDSTAGTITQIQPDGTVTLLSSSFSNPRALAVDTNGAAYVSDTSSIRKLYQGNVSTFFGPGISNAYWGTQAGVALDGTNGLIAATDAGAILKIDLTGNYVLFAAGSGNITNAYDGPGVQAAFTGLKNVCRDSIGNYYVTDSNQVRKIEPDGYTITLAGSGAAGYADAGAASAMFNSPDGICVDAHGTVYVSDFQNNCIRKITQNDWDNDGIPDSVEGGTTPYVVGVDDRYVDSDGDGVSNADEYLNGTDPLDPRAFLLVSHQPKLANNQITLNWSGSGRTYMYCWVQYSEDLIHWTNLGPGTQVQIYTTPSTNVTFTFTDTITNRSCERGFYRLIGPPMN